MHLLLKDSPTDTTSFIWLYVAVYVLLQIVTVKLTLLPVPENDGPKPLTIGYIPMTDMYDKDVIHIFLRPCTYNLWQICTRMDKVNDIPKDIKR